MEDNSYEKTVYSMYCYPGTSVFKNKFNIKDQQLLERQESILVIYQTSKLMLDNKCSKSEEILYKTAKSNKFDINHYLAIHKFLFGGIYPDFAGKIRSENISKGGFTFCTHFQVYPYLEEELKKLNKKILPCKTIDEFLNVLSESYGEINMIHPFNEGNGRTQREFFRQFVEYYSKKLGFNELTLDYSFLREDPTLHDDIIKGSIQACVYCKYDILKYVLERLLKEKETILKRGR